MHLRRRGLQRPKLLERRLPLRDRHQRVIGVDVVMDGRALIGAHGGGQVADIAPDLARHLMQRQAGLLQQWQQRAREHRIGVRIFDRQSIQRDLLCARGIQDELAFGRISDVGQTAATQPRPARKRVFPAGIEDQEPHPRATLLDPGAHEIDRYAMGLDQPLLARQNHRHIRRQEEVLSGYFNPVTGEKERHFIAFADTPFKLDQRPRHLQARRIKQLRDRKPDLRERRADGDGIIARALQVRDRRGLICVDTDDQRQAVLRRGDIGA